MDIEKICSLVAKKYLLKNDVKDEKLFLEEVKDSSYDKVFLSEYVKNEDFFPGVFLRLTTIYILNKMEVKTPKDINNFTEKISSINLEEYKELLKEKKHNVMPIVYNSITIKTSEKYLRQKSTKIDLEDKNLSNYIDVLANFCKKGEVFAMAAVQLGIPKRIIYIKNTNLELVEKYINTGKKDEDYNEQRVLINPKIVKRIGLTEFWEACASCLDNFGHVYRPYEIEMEYYDLKKKKHNQIFKGFEATVLSHEYDHLDGILHIDKADKILVMDAEKRREFRKTHKYNIISKTDDYLLLLNNKKNKREGEVKNE